MPKPRLADALVAVVAIVALLMAWPPRLGVRACPYYVETVPESNFTESELATAIATAQVTGLPLFVCFDTTVPVDLSIPTLNAPVTIRGEFQPDGAEASWNFEDFSNATVLFEVTSPGVVFENLIVIYANTFARVSGAGSLRLNSVTMFGGLVGIISDANAPPSIIGAPGPDTLPTGVDCNGCYFDTTQTGIETNTRAPIRLHGTFFIDSLRAGMISTLPSGSAYDHVILSGVQFSNVAVSLGTLLNDGSAINFPISTTTAFYSHMTFTTSFSKAVAVPPDFGTGTGGGANCPPVLSNSAQLLLQIVAVALLIVVFIGFIFSNIRRNPVNLVFRKTDE